MGKEVRKEVGEADEDGNVMEVDKEVGRSWGRRWEADEDRNVINVGKEVGKG